MGIYSETAIEAVNNALMAGEVDLDLPIYTQGDMDTANRTIADLRRRADEAERAAAIFVKAAGGRLEVDDKLMLETDITLFRLDERHYGKTVFVVSDISSAEPKES